MEMLGNSRAVATPTDSLAAIRFCSACMISGRRSISLEGKPAVTWTGKYCSSSVLFRVRCWGAIPIKTESWFSAASLACSPRGIVAREEASSTSACFTSSLEVSPPLNLL